MGLGRMEGLGVALSPGGGEIGGEANVVPRPRTWWVRTKDWVDDVGLLAETR